jgi:hypothetical protein
MAAVTSAVVAAGVSAYGANRQTSAARDAGRASQRGADAATAEQRRQFDLSRSDQLPWLQAGQDALSRQQQFLAGDFSGFETSPDYAYALQEGFKGLDRGAAAAGGLWSGGADADRIKLGQGLASQNANNYWNRLAGLSNTGQNTSGNLGSLGANMASNIGGYQMSAANARASAYQQQGAAQAGFANQLAGYAGYLGGQWGKRPSNSGASAGGFGAGVYNGLSGRRG